MKQGEILSAMAPIDTMITVCKKKCGEIITISDSNMMMPFVLKAQKAAEKLSRFALEYFNSRDEHKKELSKLICGRFNMMLIEINRVTFNGYKHDVSADWLNNNVQSVIDILFNTVEACESLADSLPPLKLNEDNKDEEVKETNTTIKLEDNSINHNMDATSGENVIDSRVREITWEDRKQCFKEAVLYAMEIKKLDGYYFDSGAKWIAPYRFAIDMNDIMYDQDDPRKPKDLSVDQYEEFDGLATELNFKDSSFIRVPFKRSYITQITKPSYKRFAEPFPWMPDDFKDSTKSDLLFDMTEIYKDIKFTYNNKIEVLKVQS